MNFTNSFEKNIELMQNLFDCDDTFVIKMVKNKHNTDMKIAVMLLSCMVNSDILNRDVICRLGDRDFLPNIEAVTDSGICVHTSSYTTDANLAASSIAGGDCVVVIDDLDKVLIVDVKGMKQRDISAPDAEMSLAGPGEGFNENIMTNLSLIKKRISSPSLKSEFIRLGRSGNCVLSVCYIDGIVKQRHVRMVKERINALEIDGVMDINHIAELIRDNRHSLFKTYGKTGRPDVVCSKLLEGRVAVILNGSPTALTLPFIFVENFHAADDYYLNALYANVGRVLRVFGFFMSFLLPSMYIAVIMHHQSMLPIEWLYSIIVAQNGVPIPSVIEIILLFIAFEILRETGTRMPSGIGLALNVVGAIVLGQAAVDAKIVSSPMVIIVAFAGTAGLMVNDLKGAVFYIRAGFILLSAFVGMAGVFIGFAALLLLLYDMQSLDVPFMYTTSLLSRNSCQDTLIRGYFWKMENRQKRFSDNIVRFKRK